MCEANYNFIKSGDNIIPNLILSITENCCLLKGLMTNRLVVSLWSSELGEQLMLNCGDVICAVISTF